MPAANVQGQDPNETTPAQEWMVRRLVTSDFLYWSARKLAPKKLIGFLLATGPALLDDIVRDQRLNIAVMMPLAVAFQATACGAKVSLERGDNHYCGECCDCRCQKPLASPGH